MKFMRRLAAVAVLVVPATLLAQADSMFSAPIEVKSHGVTMRATLFVAAGPGPHATLVSLKGFPGGNSTTLQAFLQSKGFNAIAINFRGQQESDGTYDVTGTPADAAAFISFLRSDSAQRRFRIDPRRIGVSGTGAGSFGALTTAANDESIRCLALVVPYNFAVTLLPLRDNPVARAAMAAQLQPMIHATPPPVRLDSGFVNRTVDAAASLDLRPVAMRLPGRSVLMIGAAQDATAPLNTHFYPVRDGLKSARATVRDTVLDDTHNLPASGATVFELVAGWFGQCVR
jgi:alpha/beta superfamily hydrolase